jgi:RimJ/RimL family protein N-acetyltransferase
MSAQPLFSGDGFTIRPLATSETEAVQALLVACDDYSVMLTDKPHGPDAAAEVFAALPPGKEQASKLVLGIEADGGLIGILDAIRDYPEPGVWFLGLLLLRPEQRTRGLGAKVYEAFSEWAFAQGCDVIRLGVVSQNARAEAFWKRLGFQEVTRQPMQFAGKDTEAVVMQDVLVADPE